MSDKNSVLTRKILVYAVSLFVAALLALYLTMYTIAAYMVARWIIEESGRVFWCGTPGSLFPWPKEPGYMVDVLSSATDPDTFVYKYLVKTNMLILIVAATYLQAAHLAHRLKRITKHT